MRTFECSILFGDTTTLSDYIPADTRSKARYAFYKRHFGDESYSEMFRYIKCRVSGYRPAPPVDHQQELVDKLNATFAIGDKMQVKQDDGTILHWTVRNGATMLGGHSAVIWVNEHVGCYAAERVMFP